MPDPNPAPSIQPASKQLLPWLVAVAFFMESLDTTILNTAVPAIAAALKVAPLSMKAVLSSYTLSLAVFIPISGWMADRFGTLRVFASPSHPPLLPFSSPPAVGWPTVPAPAPFSPRHRSLHVRISSLWNLHQHPC